MVAGRPMKEVRIRRKLIVASLAALVGAGCWGGLRAQEQAPSAKQKVIFDTDIGDDIDDAFALALAVSSPKLEVIGVTTAWGNTDLRARLAERLLKAMGHGEIPVAVGPKTQASSTFTQARWAEVEPEPAKGWPDATDFTLNAIRRNPGEITLIAVAPFSNVGALHRSGCSDVSQAEESCADGRVDPSALWRPRLFAGSRTGTGIQHHDGPRVVAEAVCLGRSHRDDAARLHATEARRNDAGHAVQPGNAHHRRAAVALCGVERVDRQSDADAVRCDGGGGCHRSRAVPDAADAHRDRRQGFHAARGGRAERAGLPRFGFGPLLPLLYSGDSESERH